jgi:hypothetical protein
LGCRENASLSAREHLSLRLSVAHSAIDHPPLGHLLFSWAATDKCPRQTVLHFTDGLPRRCVMVASIQPAIMFASNNRISEFGSDRLSTRYGLRIYCVQNSLAPSSSLATLSTIAHACGRQHVAEETKGWTQVERGISYYTLNCMKVT